MLTTPATASAPYVVAAPSFKISMLSIAAAGMEFRSTNMTFTKPGSLPVGYGATRRPAMGVRVGLELKPRRGAGGGPPPGLGPVSVFGLRTAVDVNGVSA